ncbi:IS110 family transposase, partial (plasmid) [Staphylococcus aureus]
QRPPKQLKQSIHRIKQLNDAMIQLAQQLNYFKNIHSIPGI